MEWINERTYYLTLVGSRAYGMSNEDSDYDYAGICIPPKEYYCGFLNNFEQTNINNSIRKYFNIQLENSEGTIYGINKFFKLTSNCNPNMVEILYTDNKDKIYI